MSVSTGSSARTTEEAQSFDYIHMQHTQLNIPLRRCSAILQPFPITHGCRLGAVCCDRDSFVRSDNWTTICVTAYRGGLAMLPGTKSSQIAWQWSGDSTRSPQPSTQHRPFNLSHWVAGNISAAFSKSGDCFNR
jgi:hypothetical protein